MEIEVMQLVISPLVTVIGWFVAAWWAIEQVKVAHNKNAELQQQLMRDSHKRELAKELIEIYKCVARAGDILTQAIFSFSLNYGFQKNGVIEGVEITADNLIPDINEAYNELSQEITRLDMWLKACEGHLPDTANLTLAILYYRQTFSGSAEERGTDELSWAGYQGLLVSCSSGHDIDPDILSGLSGELAGTLNKVLSKLTDGTAVVNKELVTTKGVGVNKNK